MSARVLIGSNLIAEAMSRRTMAPTAANALGRALMGAVLIAVESASGEESESRAESVQLQLRGDGPLGSVIAIADSRGRVRGTVAQPGVDLSLSDGSPDLPRALGLGTLSVVRHKPGWREPYSGTVPLTSGEIAQDLTLYLSESEQIPSAMGLGVAMANDESAVVSAGFLLQMLPGASDEEAARAEANVRAMPPLSDLLLRGTDCDALLDRLLDGMGSRRRHRSQVCFHCPCTRERALRTLLMLESEELQSLVDEDQNQEVCCHFCAQRYLISPREVQGLLTQH